MIAFIKAFVQLIRDGLAMHHAAHRRRGGNPWK
ncbi:hypothetical protein [Stenotrophomonas phage BUCTxx99]|nr:hypothetical protein [Stenotrophomonas phage BUCTxx99]